MESRRRSTGQRTWEQDSPTYRQEWERRYGTSGRRWEEYEPYYHYVYVMYYDPQYQNRDWADVEADYGQGYPNWARQHGYQHDQNVFQRVKNELREFWDHLRGRDRDYDTNQ